MPGLGAVDVGVDARGAEADVVGDEHPDTVEQEDVHLGRGVVERDRRFGDVDRHRERHLLGRRTLITLADGAGPDDDGRTRTLAGPRCGGLDDCSGDGDRLVVNVARGVHHLLRVTRPLVLDPRNLHHERNRLRLEDRSRRICDVGRRHVEVRRRRLRRGHRGHRRGHRPCHQHGRSPCTPNPRTLTACRISPENSHRSVGYPTVTGSSVPHLTEWR